MAGFMWQDDNYFTPVPAGYEFGDNPDWMIVSRTATQLAGGAPLGYYLPDLDFLSDNQDAIVNYVNT